MAKRLAILKAESVVDEFPNAIIIGSDQVAVLDNKILRKPGTVERACEQLARMRCVHHQLFTAMHVIDTEKDISRTVINQANLWLRKDVSDQQIEHYVLTEKPLNCAGSYKLEGAGIALFDKIECNDWTAIIGLPLLELGKILHEMDYQIFGKQ